MLIWFIFISKYVNIYLRHKYRYKCNYDFTRLNVVESIIQRRSIYTMQAHYSNWQIINLSLHLVSTIDLDDYLCDQHEFMMFSLQTYNLIADVLANYTQHELRIMERTTKFLHEAWCKVLFDIYNIVIYTNTPLRVLAFLQNLLRFWNLHKHPMKF